MDNFFLMELNTERSGKQIDLHEILINTTIFVSTDFFERIV
jgi:hypothetical protein